MNDKDFAKKAFEDALKETIGAIDKPATDEEYQAYKLLIAENSDAIMDAVKNPVEAKDKVNIGPLAKAIVITGQQKAFAALVGTAMTVCFHIGWIARTEEAK